jgi:hypothetical protein
MHRSMPTEKGEGRYGFAQEFGGAGVSGFDVKAPRVSRRYASFRRALAFFEDFRRGATVAEPRSRASRRCEKHERASDDDAKPLADGRDADGGDGFDGVQAAGAATVR